MQIDWKGKLHKETVEKRQVKEVSCIELKVKWSTLNSFIIREKLYNLLMSFVRKRVLDFAGDYLQYGSCILNVIFCFVWDIFMLILIFVSRLFMGLSFFCI